jgi:hypothetical protein
MRRLAFALALSLPLAACARPCRQEPAPSAAAAAAARPVPAQVVSKGRTRADIEAAFDRSRAETAHIAMLSEEEAHAAMPELYKKKAMPYLVRVGGLQPRTMEALLATARTLRKEGGLDAKLLNDVFWEVSSANDCFY